MISKEGYMDIQALYRQGMTVRAISRRLGLHRNTVKKHLASDEFPRYRKTRRRESILAPYHQTIRDYLEQDNYRASWIHTRLKNQGYPGSYDTVKDYVHAKPSGITWSRITIGRAGSINAWRTRAIPAATTP